MSKLKANANEKIRVTQKLTVVLERVENIVGKGENAGYQHFLLFLPWFQKASYMYKVDKSQDCVEKVKSIRIRQFQCIAKMV